MTNENQKPIPVPSVVSDDENVARALFEPSFFSDDGNLAPSAFYLKQLKSGAENYISVFREKYCDVETLIKGLSPRDSNDSLCGYASLNVADIRAISIQDSQPDPQVMMTMDVRSHKTSRCKAHAGIHIYNDEVEMTADDNAQDPIPSGLLWVLKQLQKLSDVRLLSPTTIPCPVKFDVKVAVEGDDGNNE